MATGTIYCDWFRHFENGETRVGEHFDHLALGVLHQYVRHLDTSYDNETGAQL